MPLNIGRVDAQVHIGEGSLRRSADDDAPGNDAAGTASMSDEELRRRIRPMVIEIMEEELARFQRQQG